MSASNIKSQETTKSPRLVKIFPVETAKDVKDKFGEKRKMNRHWQSDKTGRFFIDNLKAQQLKPGLINARVKIENLLLKDETDFIVYEYKNRPMIKLNIKDGQFYTFESIISLFGKEAVEHQAHIILDILKTNKLSNAQRGKENYQTNARQTLNQLKSYSKEK